MNPMIRNILAVIAGIVVGMVVNMGLIMLGSVVIPLPDGVDVTNAESISASIHLFELKHFIFPFLAHALGTLAGAYVVAKLAVSHQMRFALSIGAFFLIGGIANLFLIPGPTWFAIVDLVGAYIPMGWIGGRLVGNKLSS